VFKTVDTRHNSSRDFVAVKLVIKDDDVIRNDSKYYAKEVKLQQGIEHRNVVKFLYSLNLPREPERLYIVMELMDLDLFKWIRNQEKFRFDLQTFQNKVMQFASELCQGIAYCHREGVMHRDLKPENLLIDSRGTLKIGDFGMAEQFKRGAWCELSPDEEVNFFRQSNVPYD
jgi:serine/threonine protein kinase